MSLNVWQKLLLDGVHRVFGTNIASIPVVIMRARNMSRVENVECMYKIKVPKGNPATVFAYLVFLQVAPCFIIEGCSQNIDDVAQETRIKKNRAATKSETEANKAAERKVERESKEKKKPVVTSSENEADTSVAGEESCNNSTRESSKGTRSKEDSKAKTPANQKEKADNPSTSTQDQTPQKATTYQNGANAAMAALSVAPSSSGKKKNLEKNYQQYQALQKKNNWGRTIRTKLRFRKRAKKMSR